MLTLIPESLYGPVTLDTDADGWKISVQQTHCSRNLQVWKILLDRSQAAVPPKFTLRWSMPFRGALFRMFPNCGDQRRLLPVWSGARGFNFCGAAPMLLFGDAQGMNCGTFAVSEALRTTILDAGVKEETCTFFCSASFFEEKEAPLSHYEVDLRFDVRKKFYADLFRETIRWFEEYHKPSPVPPAAWEPLYSAWYSYHQNVHDCEMLEECRLAAPYGFRTLIVDDGWQTDDTNRGYAYCGDWEISKNRFPDMKRHVAEVHKLGIKYMIWYSVPFVGFKSKNYDRFRGKYLYEDSRRQTAALDPRFPEVREFLIQCYETAVREWDLDGLKLDFIDSFGFRGNPDPAIAENYAGRDIPSLPIAVDQLLSDVAERLSKIKKDLLFEFRQGYTGPAIRKYGNMLRASDCPADRMTNRIRTMDLRLTAGNSAVHSDMLEWNPEERTEKAAAEFLSVLFSVPQISVRLGSLPAAHKKMLSFWLGFWRKHRDLLLKGHLVPLHPELNYPVIQTSRKGEFLAAVYASGQLAEVPESAEKAYLVNASEEVGLTLNLNRKPIRAEAFTCTGKKVCIALPPDGITEIAVPESGLLILTF